MDPDMKKAICVLLTASAIASLTACGREEIPQTVPTTAAQITVETEMQTVPTETFTEPIWGTVVTETETAPVSSTEVLWETEPPLVLPEKFEILETPEVVYATRDVNIRLKPTVQSDSPGKLKKGESALRLGSRQDGWSAVQINEELCFVASKYLTAKAPAVPAESGKQAKVTETAAGGTLYASHWVRLRQGPGADTAMLGTIPEGARVEQLAICSNGWTKVSYGGMVGYVAGGYLTGKQISPETTEPTKGAQETTETTAESSKASESTAASESSAASESTAASESSAASESTAAPESSEASESSASSESSAASESSEASGSQESSEGGEK